MAFNPKIRYNPRLSAEENLKACMNWLNFLLREMTVGRVPQHKRDVAQMDARVAANEEVNNITFVALAETQVLDDNTVARHPEVFEEWREGVAYKAGNMRRCPITGKLYRVREGQAHTSVTGWEPSCTPAMWAMIDVTHAGTMDDPVVAGRGMEYVYGLYYRDEEDGQLYLCKRQGEPDGGKIVLHFMPHELVGQYFEEVI